jgi:radical SAM superfamily enzyme YgiQ (UPF0313 family)
MRVLLIKPRPTAVQFGLAPFFQTEPLGLEYVASALIAAGHQVRIVDLRFERRPIVRLLRDFTPRVVGIACLHILDVPATLQLAAAIKQHDANVTVAVGGHAVGSYPQALEGCRWIDAICAAEGENAMPALCAAVELGKPLSDVPSLLLPDGSGGFQPTAEVAPWLDLAEVRIPNRELIQPYQKHYCCLNYMPVWTIETARGCPHRCKFCSVWQFYSGSCRCHSPANVRADFEAAGSHVFIIDDLFWGDRDRSRELASALLASPERKRWILVQSRVDLVSQNADLLAQWRPLARNFDIFFGFESPTREGLRSLHKGADIGRTIEAVRVARELGFGVTGNFIIDPDYTEEDFRLLWDFLDAHQLYRVGFTILTPLPGTEFFEQSREKLQVFDWNQYDLHHLLWQPRLPVERFFELYCETWKRTVLNAAGRKKWWKWMAQVEIRQVGRMLRILRRTQHMLDPRAYLAESQIPLARNPEEAPEAARRPE